MKEGQLQRILILPRGAEARALHAAASRLGIETVFCFTDRDAEAAWPDEGDYAVHLALGEGEPISRVVELALDAGCDGVWAGAGRFGRSAELIEALGMAGVTSLGPYPSTLLTLADPLALRKAAQAAGLAVVPASAPLADAGALLAWIATAGLPVLLRPVEGRPSLPLFSRDAALAEHSAQSGPHIVERVVEEARTLDLPFLGDGEGGVRLFELRELSARHVGHPLLWETPVAAFDPARAQELRRGVEALARQLRWRGAGYARFLLTPDGRPYLLRLRPGLSQGQAAAGLRGEADLIEQLFAVALGRPLVPPPVGDLIEAEALPVGHAVGLVVGAAAEGVYDGVSAAAGLRPLHAPGDPILAGEAVVELNAQGPDRAALLDQLAAAVDALEAEGLALDKAPLLRLLGDPAFRAAPLSREAIAARLG